MGLTIGLLWGLCAALCIIKRDKNNSKAERKGIMLGVFFGFFGICGVLGGILQHTLLQATCVLLSVGILCVAAFFFALYRLLNCNTQIWGTYVTYQIYTGSKGYRSYFPIFRYNFGGVEYQKQTHESYSLKKINKRFAYGQIYPIWINENAPEAFITKRSLPSGHVVTLFAGILILIIYSVMLITEILG